MPMLWNKLNFPWRRYLPSSGDYEQKQSANAHKERQTLTQIDFSQGLNNVDDPTVIGERQVSDSKNMVFSSNYGMEKRHGTRVVHRPQKDSDLSEATITFMDVYKDFNTGLEFNVEAGYIEIPESYDEPAHTLYKMWILNKEEFTLYNGEEYEVVPKDSIIFEFRVSGEVRGINFNGYYYFVDEKYIRRFRFDYNYGFFTVKRLVNDPKFRLSFVTSDDFEVVTNEPFDKSTYTTAINTEYSTNTNYYVDALGLVKLEHGEEPGKVNAENYQNYFIECEKSEEPYEYIKLKALNISLIGYDEEYNDEDAIEASLKLNPFYSCNANFGFETIYDKRTSIDVVTGLVNLVYTTQLIPVPYIVDDVVYDYERRTARITFHQANNEEVDYMVLRNDTFRNIAASGEPAYMEYELNNIIANTLFRRYTPRSGSLLLGEEVENDECFWYQPSSYQLADPYNGENYVPSNPRLILSNKGRVWTTGDYGQDAEFRGSYTNVVSYFPAACSLGLNPNGDRIVDMFEFDGYIVVGRTKDIYKVSGASTGTTMDALFNIDKMDSPVGFMCKNCGALTNNAYLFLGNDGRLYKMTTPSQNVEYLMVKPLSNYIDLFKKPIGLTKEQMLNTRAISFNNNVYWAIGDKIINYSYDKQAFTYFSDLSVRSWFTDNIDLYLFEKNDRMVVDKTLWSDRVYGSERDAISCELVTRTYNNNTTNYKYWEQAMITFAHGDYPKMGCNIQYIFDEDDLYDRQSFSSSRFGAAQWGSGSFSIDRSQKTFWFRIDAKSRQMTIRFYDSEVDNSFEVIDVSVLLTSRDVRK